MSSGDQEAAVLHDLFFATFVFEPDVEAEADDVDVSAGAPGCAGVFAVGIAEGDVDAGKFFVLQNIADDAGDANVGADGELTDAIRIFVSVGVGPKIPLKLLVGAGAGDDTVLRDLDGEWSVFEETVSGAQPVTNDAINNESPVDLAG